MKTEDSAKFDAILSRLFRTMGKPVPDADVKRVWWDVMGRASLEDFAQACADYVREEECFPVPAAVKRYLPKRTGALKLVTHNPEPANAETRKMAIGILRKCRLDLG